MKKNWIKWNKQKSFLNVSPLSSATYSHDSSSSLFYLIYSSCFTCFSPLQPLSSLTFFSLLLTSLSLPSHLLTFQFPKVPLISFPRLSSFFHHPSSLCLLSLHHPLFSSSQSNFPIPPFHPLLFPLFNKSQNECKRKMISCCKWRPSSWSGLWSYQLPVLCFILGFKWIVPPFSSLNRRIF